MFLERDGQTLFGLGMYERPRTREEWQTWRAAGINLVHCQSRDQLDEAQASGMFGWVSVPMVLPDGDDGSALAERVDSLKDHPALAVWEAPDEAILAAWRNRAGSRDPATIAETERSFDALVRCFGRGAALVRKHDPGPKLWLNEAVISPVDVLARCAPFVDIVGFDYYPIPERTWRPMNLMGPDTSRFRDAAPGKELWIVQQAFNWAHVGEDPAQFGDAAPTRDQCRFMAWQAILHGATGLLWWGSAHEKRPFPFLDDLMSVVHEIDGLHEFLNAGPISGVDVRTNRSLRAPTLGCSCSVRRVGERTLLVLLNEDSYPAEAVITGIDWLAPTGLRPVSGPYEELVSARGELRTHMEGHETRLYVAG